MSAIDGLRRHPARGRRGVEGAGRSRDLRQRSTCSPWCCSSCWCSASCGRWSSRCSPSPSRPARRMTACHYAFGEVHILTLTFGTSLIGVSVDYALHYFVNRHASGRRPGDAARHRPRADPRLHDDGRGLPHVPHRADPGAAADRVVLRRWPRDRLRGRDPALSSRVARCSAICFRQLRLERESAPRHGAALGRSTRRSPYRNAGTAARAVGVGAAPARRDRRRTLAARAARRRALVAAAAARARRRGEARARVVRRRLRHAFRAGDRRRHPRSSLQRLETLEPVLRISSRQDELAGSPEPELRAWYRSRGSGGIASCWSITCTEKAARSMRVMSGLGFDAGRRSQRGARRSRRRAVDALTPEALAREPAVGAGASPVVGRARRGARGGGAARRQSPRPSAVRSARRAALPGVQLRGPGRRHLAACSASTAASPSWLMLVVARP